MIGLRLHMFCREEKDLILLAQVVSSAECEVAQRRRAALLQHSFYQLRVHLKRGKDLVARDKSGECVRLVQSRVRISLFSTGTVSCRRDERPVRQVQGGRPADAQVPHHTEGSESRLGRELHAGHRGPLPAHPAQGESSRIKSWSRPVFLFCFFRRLLSTALPSQTE